MKLKISLLVLGSIISLFVIKELISKNSSVFTSSHTGDSILTVMDIITPSQYDGYDKNTPYNFFDARKTADPLHGIKTDTTSASNPAHGWDKTKGSPQRFYGVYFPSAAGSNYGVKYPGRTDCKVIVDFTGRTDWTDTTLKAVIHKLFFKNAEEAGIKIYLYNYDKVLRQPYALRPLYDARPDSLLIPFDSVTTDGSSGGWIERTVNDSMRYMLLCIQGQPNQHIANFSEIVPYGYMTGAIDPSLVRPQFTGPYPSTTDANHTQDKMMGSTSFKGVNVMDNTRMFLGLSGFDTTRAPGVPARYQNIFSVYPDITFDYMRRIESAGKHYFNTLHTANAYNMSKGYGNANVTDPRMDPRLPSSWVRAGDFAYNYAALMGDSAIPNAQTKWGSIPNGQNVAKASTFDNETMAHGVTLPSLVVKKSVEYDGHQGTIGTPGRIGVKNADVHFQLGFAPDIDPNINTVKVVSFYSAIFRSDHLVPFDFYEVHKYFTNKDSLPGVTFGYDEQIGMHREMPAKVYKKNNLNFITYWEKFMQQFYTYMPTRIRLIWGEHGMSNYGRAAKTEMEAAQVWDIFASPPFGNYNALQGKAVAMAQYRVLTPFIPGLDQFYEYTLENQPGPDTLQHSTLFFSHGQAGGSSIIYPFNIERPFPNWFVKACTDSVLKGYVKDSLWMGDATRIWKGRYRSLAHPDNVVYFVFRPTETGDSSVATIHFDRLNAVKEVIPSFTNVYGTSKMLTTNNGNVTRPMRELVQFYIGVETASAQTPGSGKK